MAYPYVCDPCLDGDCIGCEGSRGIPTEPEFGGGGFCVCQHGDNDDTPFEAKVREQSEVSRRHRPR